VPDCGHESGGVDVIEAGDGVLEVREDAAFAAGVGKGAPLAGL